MRLGTEFEKPSLRACGHSDVVRYAYMNQRQRSLQEVRAIRTICAGCKAGVQKLHADHVGQPAAHQAMWKARLPELHGTPGQVGYASSVRSKVGAQYFSLLEAVSTSCQQPGTAVRTVLRLLFAIDNCSFWIASRDLLGKPAWLFEEVEALTRSSDSFAAPHGPASVVAFWKRRRPEMVESARRALRSGPTATAA